MSKAPFFSDFLHSSVDRFLHSKVVCFNKTKKMFSGFATTPKRQTTQRLAFFGSHKVPDTVNFP